MSRVNWITYGSTNKWFEAGLGKKKTCLGIATALTFLHEESPLKIVHRDTNATNVLLDNDLNAKISDFGLAKPNEEENTYIITQNAGT
ncbi:LOW QUALITY PROTEIN: Serine-threonine/tyrosine-protein kinase, catalytic domain, partial [Dillenia turbinata]